MRLRGEVALITGGNRGIGRAIALRFGREGAHIAIGARTQSSLDAVRQELHSIGAESLAIRCDVSEDAGARELVGQAEARFGKIDLLVNNAGYFCKLYPMQDMPDAEWDLTMRANLNSAFYITRAALPGMISRRHGSILMVSSIAAHGAFPFGTPYTAAKTALLGLTRALAAEVGPHGIRVNALCPGVVTGTEMHEKVNSELQRTSGLTPEARLQAARAGALMREVPDPDQIADAALFLASSEAAMITGQTINVDGGMYFS